MNKLSKWLYRRDLSKSLPWIGLGFALGAIYHGYMMVSYYTDDNWHIANHSMMFGGFLVTMMYYVIIIRNIKRERQLTTQLTELIIENHHLKSDHLVKKHCNSDKVS